MAGLRERQKEKRYQAIIAAALSLIKDNGYSASSIEDIAARAEVGVGTVYNYFHTKSEIILELYKNDVAGNLRNGKEVINSSSDSYIDAAIKLLVIYSAGYFADREKSLLREIYSVVMSEQALARQEFMQLDYTLIDQLADLLTEAQKHGSLKPEIDPREAAYILFSMAMYDFMMFVTDDAIKFSQLEEYIQRHTQIIFAGLSG